MPLSPRTASAAEPRAITVGTQGACNGPVLSPDGKRAAWLEMPEDGYEADRNHVMIYEIESGRRWTATPKWDRSPSAIVWGSSSNKVYLQAEDQGHVKIFELDLAHPDAADASKAKEPTRLTSEHSVAHIEALSSGNLLVTWNSLTTPNQVSLLDCSNTDKVVAKPLASLTKSLRDAKTLSAGEEFWFAGDGGEQIHGWILFPPEAAKARAAGTDKKWPLAFLCHGGPQSAWNDGWSTRCECGTRSGMLSPGRPSCLPNVSPNVGNPNSWAGHGYITVAINRSGSTGFGQDFCDKIKQDWGGAPFRVSRTLLVTHDPAADQ